MITKITKLKKFGIFRDFIWNNNIPQFRDFNAFYGWNGTGKTTISRALSIIETGEIKDLELEDDAVCVIETSNGNLTISKDALSTNQLEILRFLMRILYKKT